MGWFSKKKEPKMPLRDMLLGLSPDQVELTQGPEHPNVWAVLVDENVGVATYCLSVIADGTTSLYWSTGGGMIGCGEHEPVRAASRALLAVAEECLAEIPMGDPRELPPSGHIRFSFRTFEGDRTHVVPRSTIMGDGGPGLKLYSAAQDVITQIRLVEQRRKR